MKSRMNILFFADMIFEDYPGGSRVVARELAGGLVARGHQVTFLVRSKGSEQASETMSVGARVVRFAAPPGSTLKYIQAGQDACTQLLAEESYDIIHTHFAYAAHGPLKAVPKNIPHVRSFYGPWHDEGLVEDRKALADKQSDCRTPRQSVRCAAAYTAMKTRYALRTLVEQQNLRRSRVAIVLSEHSRREVLALKFPPKNIVKIAGGVDVGRFVPAGSRAAVRGSLGLPVGCPILLSIRRLAPRMGLDNLIKAMPAIVARQPKTLLLIGGQGPERARLEALIQALDLTANVRMLGFISEDKLVPYYQAADAFVLPTLALEGFGLVTTEALSCGIPVLGTAVGATPEILSSLDKRLVVPRSSPEALAATVLDFLEGGWSCGLTPARLRQLILDRYSWNRHVSAVERIYAGLLCEGSPNHSREQVTLAASS